METLNREFVLKMMERATQRAMARVLEYEDPIFDQDEDDLTKAERDKYLALLERDHAVFATVCAWIEKYVPAFETCDVSNELLEQKHAEYDRRYKAEAPVSNIVNLSDYRKG